jgi:hypothetical protein
VDVLLESNEIRLPAENSIILLEPGADRKMKKIREPISGSLTSVLRFA